VVFSSEEFGFVRLDDAWATGSSMLPQKKNPDVAELARGKAGRLVGHLTGFLTTLKGLPLSYNRDLQEDKEPLFDALDQVTLALVGLDGLISTATFDLDRMQSAADGPGLVAVDLAEWLVRKGVPFRDAHGTVSTLVRESIERGVPLGELIEAHPDFEDEALEVLDVSVALRRRTTPGGTGPGAVAVQLERFGHRLAADLARLAEREA
jgi:argininosuccinate lyase